MRSRGLLSLIGLLAALALLGACSSGSGSKGLNTTNSSTKSSVEAGGGSGGVTTGSNDTGGDDTGHQFSGDSGSAFCNDFRHFDSYFSDHSGDEDSDSRVLDAYKTLRSDAPAQLKDDLDAIISYAEQLQNLGSGNQSEAGSLVSGSLSQKAETAVQEVEQYVNQVCGLDLS